MFELIFKASRIFNFSSINEDWDKLLSIAISNYENKRSNVLVFLEIKSQQHWPYPTAIFIHDLTKKSVFHVESDGWCYLGGLNRVVTTNVDNDQEVFDESSDMECRCSTAFKLIKLVIAHKKKQEQKLRDESSSNVKEASSNVKEAILLASTTLNRK